VSVETIIPLDYYSLLEMLPTPDCAICNLLLRDADRFLDGLLYERVNDADTLTGIRERRGLCSEHAWQLTRYHGSSLGVAILYRAALNEALEVIQSALNMSATTGDAAQSGLARILGLKPGQNAAPLDDALEPVNSCMACALRVGIWSTVKDELHVISDKNDNRHMNEPMGDEKESWVRAIRGLAGTIVIRGALCTTSQPKSE
jgi:hypothetical protein